MNSSPVCLSDAKYYRQKSESLIFLVVGWLSLIFDACSFVRISVCEGFSFMINFLAVNEVEKRKQFCFVST